KKVTLDGLELEAPALFATASSSSSLAGRLWCGPHIWSCKSTGGASNGTRSSTLPRDGLSHDRPLLPKPRSSNCAARIARFVPDDAPSTTAISRLPSRVAEPTRL